MFKKREKPEENITLSGAELSKLTGEQLSKIFAATPNSSITLNLTGTPKLITQEIKKTLVDAGINTVNEVKSEENNGPK